MYGFPWNFIDPNLLFSTTFLELSSSGWPPATLLSFHIIFRSLDLETRVREHRLTTQPQAPPVSDSFAPFGHSRTASPAGHPLGSFASPQASLGQHPVLGF